MLIFDDDFDYENASGFKLGVRRFEVTHRDIRFEFFPGEHRQVPCLRMSVYGITIDITGATLRDLVQACDKGGYFREVE